MPKAARRTEPFARPLNPAGRSCEIVHRAARASAATVIAAAVIGAAGGGCVTEPPPFDVRDLQRTELARAARPGEIGAGDRRPLPTTLPAAVTKQERRTNATPFTGNEPTVRMSLQEVIQRSVANNSEVKVAAYEPAIEQTRV